MAATEPATNIGRIEEIQGVVVEAVFPDKLPSIYNAIEVTFTGQTGEEETLTLEVQQHLGDGWLRAVAMSTTDGLKRGMTLTELSERVGVTTVNLSILKNNRAKAIRYSTLLAICEALDCTPGELLTISE